MVVKLKEWQPMHEGKPLLEYYLTIDLLLQQVLLEI
jgi:hypothetical protein